MANGILNIDLSALIANWRSLDAKTTCETAAVVKADGYGCGAADVSRALAAFGVSKFFVASTEEGQSLRVALGATPEIYVFSGHMAGDTALLQQAALIPLLNSAEQITRHFETLADAPFGVQLDTGMNRLGLEADGWNAVKSDLLSRNPRLIMSHLACGDTPEHPMNAQQLTTFRAMTKGCAAPRSLSATAGILLGSDYHFDLTRPGIGIYGGLPFADAVPVAGLRLPVIQIRDVAVGESVGYGNAWVAKRPSRVATLAGGYADGVIRAMGNAPIGVSLFADAQACPLIGRVSMDMIAADVTDLAEAPDQLDLLGPHQTVEDLARAAGTIGYEILTSLGHRYQRQYLAGGLT